MFNLLRADIVRNLQDYGTISLFRRIGYCLTLNSIHAVALIRLQGWLADRGQPTLVPAKLLFWFFKIEVSKKARIGPGLRLPHPMGIIIAPNVSVGRNCDLYADVRLALSHGNPEGPRIGDGVFLGDGAKVLGNVKVGDYSEIGASAVVTRSIPIGAVAVGIPARVLRCKQLSQPNLVA